jgi:tetratricopeptide (TPR) repeat protein
MPLKNTMQAQAMEPLRLEVGRLVELGRFEEALGELDGAAKRSTGSGLQLLKALPDDQLVTLLGGEGELDAGKALLLAELLNLSAEVHEEQSGADTGLSSKALRLYLEAFEADPELVEHYAPRLSALEAKLSDYALPARLERKRFEYNLRQGAYDKAEDSLFELLERGEAELLTRAEAFYRELEQRSDEELRTGGLPREEVEEGLANLEELRRHSA